MSAEERIRFLQETLTYVESQMGNVRGTKPTPANPQPGTYRVEISNDILSIRLFPGGMQPEDAVLFLDFYNFASETPINAPAGYRMWILQINRAPIPLLSVETIAGHTAVGAGLEKFMTRDGVRVRLRRPNQADFVLDVPSRSGPPRPAEPGVGQAVLME
ncbi:hypothetical protein FB45DRAFT_510844 [Roridomyces roridus]|uniref:Uncharacterized protein n=1 Tax=Roridomyces roridus TaxID=1738132 RepID=A0AAD7BWP8_9AGAR|nr:hypothetical protein FB45DRAFT_510844 [Roridomyces roridus]